MRPEDTFSGQALLQEQAYLESIHPRDTLIGQIVKALEPIAASYPDDPGTSDLDNEQPVRISLGDVRRARAVLAAVRRAQ